MHGQLAGVRPLRDRDRCRAGRDSQVGKAEQQHPDDHQGNDPTGGVDPLCPHDDSFPRSCGKRGGSRNRLLMSPMPKRDFVGERHAASFRRFEVGGGHRGLTRPLALNVALPRFRGVISRKADSAHSWAAVVYRHTHGPLSCSCCQYPLESQRMQYVSGMSISRSFRLSSVRGRMELLYQSSSSARLHRSGSRGAASRCRHGARCH